MNRRIHLKLAAELSNVWGPPLGCVETSTVPAHGTSQILETRMTNRLSPFRASALVGVILAVLLPTAPLFAQDRMPPIPPGEMTASQREGVAEHERIRGVPISGGPWVPLMRSPEVLRRTRAMGDYLRFDSALPPRLSEFVILMTARRWTQQYEWYVHRDIAIDAGLNPAIAGAIAEGRTPSDMADDEAILYAVFTELHETASVSDGTYDRALAEFGEQGVIDAVGIIGYYSLLAMVMNTARTPLPEGIELPLSALP